MIKKIIILLLVLVLLFPVEALANDGGAMLDDNKYLSIDVKLDSKEAEIDGDFSFAVTLKNKSKDLIKLIEITQVFKGNTVSFIDETFEVDVYDISLNPGEKVRLDIKTKVPKYQKALYVIKTITHIILILIST